MKSNLVTDVVVVGAGFAGLSAALEARQQGAEVIVLSRMGLLANNSAISGGHVALVGTPLQKEMGIKDSPELYARDLLKSNNYSVDAELTKILTIGATELYNWLAGFGVQFSVLVPWPGHSVTRIHHGIETNGSGMVKLLHLAAQERGIDIHLGTAATDLVTGENGRIVGVKARDRSDQLLEIQANCGVVLAAGGFAKNKEMMAEYIPKLVEWPSHSAGGSTGDGIRMSMDVGAALASMDSVVMGYGVLPRSGKYKGHLAMPMSLQLAMAEGIAVNKEGCRFMDESVTYARGASGIMQQTDCICFIVFDEQTKDKPQLREYNEVFTGRTVEELAAGLGIEKRALAETITGYNESVDRGTVPDVYATEPTVRRHRLQGPLFAMPLSTVVIMTHGGVKINTSAQVIHHQGYPIPGLYAAGDNAVGLGGISEVSNACPGYLSATGNLTAFCFGRIAGRNAAKASNPKAS